MVFFQAVLLAGYAYAHLLGRLFGRQRAGLVHLLLLAVTAMTLPIAIAPNWGAPPADGTALWLFGLFAASIGLPFFTLSASAPLLQSWFAASGHREASNPYVLYAASNLGSFAALFAYPVVVEPLLTLKMQAGAWSVGFAVFALLVTAVAFVLGRGNGVTGAAPTPTPTPAGRVKGCAGWPSAWPCSAGPWRPGHAPAPGTGCPRTCRTRRCEGRGRWCSRRCGAAGRSTAR